MHRQTTPTAQRRAVRAVGFGTLLVVAFMGCSRGADSRTGAAAGAVQAAESAQAVNPEAPIMLRGTIVSAAANALVLKSDTGLITVKVAQPFHVYARVPSDLSRVQESSFIGVTTVKQPDGSEQATEIHLFPEELRGLGEGSRMMAPDTSATASRMTNGNVSASRMTNGAASPSRMSNGTVGRGTGSDLVVQYPGGSQTVTVPANTPVTEFKIASKALVAGDQVAVLAKKGTDGALTADKALFTAK